MRKEVTLEDYFENVANVVGKNILQHLIDHKDKPCNNRLHYLRVMTCECMMYVNQQLMDAGLINPGFDISELIQDMSLNDLKEEE